MKMATVLSLREKRGAPHLWVESLAASRAGFEPGIRFSVELQRNGVVLRVAHEGDRTVSRKLRGASVSPVIDINSRQDLAPLAGHDAVRVVFGEQCIYVSLLASEVRRQRRLARLQAHLTGQCLDTAGVACGGGILSHALHAGLEDAGLQAQTRVANEIRVDLVEHAMVHNEVFDEATIMLNMPLQELAYDEEVMRRLPEVDVLELGLPCSGASPAGRAKNRLALPEEHPLVGALIAPAIAVIAKLNPVALLQENVPAYARSASAAILRTQLRDMGYDVQERVLLGTDWGELEARERWYLVATTKGIAFDLAALQPAPYPVRKLADIMDPIALDDPCWGLLQYLKDKEVRDIDAGKGFRMQIYDGREASINTLTKGLAKRRSTDPFFRHPENPELLRLPTVREHARCKGIPEHLVEGLCQGIGHELLGQSIVYRPVREIARHLGEALLRHLSVVIAPCRVSYPCAA